MPFKQSGVLVGVLIFLAGCRMSISGPAEFNAERAYQDAAAQVGFGSRSPGTEGHEQMRRWMTEELKNAGWTVDVQEGIHQDTPIYNLIAERNWGDPAAEGYWVVLGAHYDTRFISDQDPDAAIRMTPVPGANDGASGVAVLLELSRLLPRFANVRVTLAFFDAEDNGHLPGWDWIIGSQMYAASLDHFPDAVVIVDMVGDADQNIYLEKSSDPVLAGEIWRTAADLGVSTFIAEPKHSILDDHTPFLMLGIPAVDIIDFDYPYWHTSEDTLDKVSAQSLKNIGDVLLSWLYEKDDALTASSQY